MHEHHMILSLIQAIYAVLAKKISPSGLSSATPLYVGLRIPVADVVSTQ